MEKIKSLLLKETTWLHSTGCYKFDRVPQLNNLLMKGHIFGVEQLVNAVLEKLN
ncbi:hypothetical protein LguiA_002431 [Lonicera macranthoides]